jgi:Ca2+-binding RTX toxin-like protein
MQIESLENRQLLSATLNTTTGALTVTGTAGNDGVYVNQISQTQLAVTERSRTGLNAVSVKVTKFNVADVKSISIDTLGGNDEVFIGRGITAPATINGGDGNDRIFAGAGSDTINGGAGNDLLSGGAGDDKINGGDGYDNLLGGAGKDTLNGDAGKDRLDGGLGDDTLNGGAGNDLILAVGGGKDTIDGGTNDTPVKGRPGDVAIVDASDIVTGVERVIKLPTTLGVSVQASVAASVTL